VENEFRPSGGKLCYLSLQLEGGEMKESLQGKGQQQLKERRETSYLLRQQLLSRGRERNQSIL